MNSLAMPTTARLGGSRAHLRVSGRAATARLRTTVMVRSQPSSARCPGADASGAAMPSIFGTARRVAGGAHESSRRQSGFLPRRSHVSGVGVSDTQDVMIDHGGGDDGGHGGDGAGGGGGGDGGDGGEEDAGDEEWDRIENVELLSLEEAQSMAKAKGMKLPADFVAEASHEGLRKLALTRYLRLMGGGAASLVSLSPAIRDRAIRDNRFMFKMIAEVIIDSSCATIAEVRKRADVFWEEFEFYLSDLIVGAVLDGLLVGMLAPAAVIGKAPRKVATKGAIGAIRRYTAALPSVALEKSLPMLGRRYTVQQRVMSVVVKAAEYSLVGIACGAVGQGIANGILLTKRKIVKKDSGKEELAIPPVFRTALVWGLFMGVSSNLRYQVVYGCERAFEATPIARKYRAVANLFTLAIRFGNNVYGGEQFVDLARWAGVQ